VVIDREAGAWISSSSSRGVFLLVIVLGLCLVSLIEASRSRPGRFAGSRLCDGCAWAGSRGPVCKGEVDLALSPAEAAHAGRHPGCVGRARARQRWLSAPRGLRSARREASASKKHPWTGEQSLDYLEQRDV
jgi:hypothetical protein